MHNWSHIKPHCVDRSGQKHQPSSLHVEHRLAQDNFNFLETLWVEFEHLPRNNGRHLPKLTPTEEKKKKKKFNNREIPPPAPSPKRKKSDWRKKQEEKEGEVWRGKGVRRGVGVATTRGQTPKQQAWESYKVAREQKNSHNTHESRGTNHIAR